jgi:hypothetical protein
MSSGSAPIEGILAEGGLRYLRNEAEDTWERNFFDAKIERVPHSSGTDQSGSVFVIDTNAASNAVALTGSGRFKALSAQAVTLTASNYVAGNTGGTGIVRALTGGTGVVPARTLNYFVTNPVTLRTGAGSNLSATVIVSENQSQPRRGDVLIEGISEWLEDVVNEIKSLPVLEQTKQDAAQIVRLCARMSLDEPLIDVDQHENVELFFKSGSSGVLLVVTTARGLNLFGNEGGEKWRSQYDLNGRVWRRELSGAMKPFALR